MKALSLWQPWAHLVASGAKRIENRPWQTRFRGRFLIHAAKKQDDPLGCAEMCAKRGIALPDVRSLPRGGIVGVAKVADCVASSKDPWFFGPWGFVLEGAIALPFLPLRGERGFFDVNDDVLAELRRLAPEAEL
jgi:hypothetical protein